MAGPPRTPTQIRKAKGNPGKRPYNKREPHIPAGYPEMPESVVTDERASAEWKRLCAMTLKTQVLTPADRSIVELASLAYSEYMAARAELEREGSTTYESETTTGARVIKAHPCVAIASDAWRRYRAAIVELGLTPAARAKVSTVDPNEETDPGESFFQ